MGWWGGFRRNRAGFGGWGVGTWVGILPPVVNRPSCDTVTFHHLLQRPHGLRGVRRCATTTRTPFERWWWVADSAGNVAVPRRDNTNARVVPPLPASWTVDVPVAATERFVERTGVRWFTVRAYRD